MRYLLMVSHGTFAPGLHSVLSMLGMDKPNVLSCSLEDGMGADEYIGRLNELLEAVGAEDEVVLLGDIQGGSPLTNALSTLAGRGLLPRTMAAAGMNLPMAVTAAMELEAGELTALRDSMIAEAQAGAVAIELDLGDDEDDEDV